MPQLKETVTRCEYDANGDLHDAHYAVMTRGELERQVAVEGGRQKSPDVYEVPAPDGHRVEYWIG